MPNPSTSTRDDREWFEMTDKKKKKKKRNAMEPLSYASSKILLDIASLASVCYTGL